MCYQSFFDNAGNEMSFREVFDLCDRSYTDFSPSGSQPTPQKIMIAGMEMDLEGYYETEGPLGGFAAIIVKKPCSWRALVYRGSNDPRDWVLNNIPGAVSPIPPPQYVEGLARAVFHQPSVVVGHSLGGGIATYAAAMTGGSAATIFPAPISPGWLGIPFPRWGTNIQNYVSPGEVLSLANLPPFRMRYGRDVWIETQPGSPTDKHLLPNVIVR
jgi:pimeloyl-ACP methyl ester carboxylesterase